MRRTPPAVEPPGGGEQQRAGTDAGELRIRRHGRAQPGDDGLRLGARVILGLAGVAGDDHQAVGRQTRRQRGETGEFDTQRSAQLRHRRTAVDRHVRPHLGGHAQRFGRPGVVEHQHVRREDEPDRQRHGRALAQPSRRVVNRLTARPSISSAPPARCTGRSTSSNTSQPVVSPTTGTSRLNGATWLAG